MTTGESGGPGGLGGPGGPGGLGGTGGIDMGALLQQAQQMQQQLSQAQDELASAEVEGSAGGGAVTARVSGAGEVLALTIDPAVCDPADTETLADLVVAAIRDGMRAAGELQSRRLGPLTSGLDLPAGPDLPRDG